MSTHFHTTKFNASYSTGFAKDSRRVLLIITKATYEINPNRTELIVHKENIPR